MPWKAVGPSLVLSIGRSIFVRAELPDFPLTFGEMKVLAGYYTADGKYRGGRPEAARQERQAAYECMAYNAVPLGNESVSANPTACMEYTVEGSIFGLGLCECKETTASQEYCSTWMCNSNSNTQSTLCRCDVEHTSGLFCDSWSCTVADSDGVEGHGDYECKRVSSSGHYCEAWNGKSTLESGVPNRRDTIEVAACECMAESNVDRVCSFWQCEEVAIEKFVRKWGVVVVYGLWGLVGTASLCYGVMTDRSVYEKRCYFFWPVLLFVLMLAYRVVLAAGVDGATIVGIMWGTPIVLMAVITVFRRWAIRRDERQAVELREINTNGDRSVLLHLASRQ